MTIIIWGMIVNREYDHESIKKQFDQLENSVLSPSKIAYMFQL